MSLLLRDLPVSVLSVNVQGIKRTHREFIDKELEEALRSQSVQKLHENLELAVERLKSTGVFDYVSVEIDILNSNTTGYETNVNFAIKEKGIPFLKMESFVRKGSVAADVGCEIQGAIRNPFGHGESAKLSVSTSTKGSHELQLNLHSPIVSRFKNSLDITLKSTEENNSFFTSYKNNIHSFELSTSSRNNQHKVSYEFALRDEVPLEHSKDTSARDASQAVLLLAGASTKSSLRYSYTLRPPGAASSSQSIFSGNNFTSTLELALPPGTASFFKTDIQAHSHYPLGPPLFGQTGLMLSFGLGLGALYPLSLSSHSPSPPVQTSDQPAGTASAASSYSLTAAPVSSLSDRFFAGGPNSLRGFAPYGVGPRALPSTGGSPSGDALGGDLKSSLLVMASVPVPFRSIAERGGRASLFLNAGSLGGAIRSTSTWGKGGILGSVRTSVGAGLTIPLGGGARADFSYAVPILKSPSDEVKGFQLGFALETNFVGSI